jgi:hypothetical protein
MIAIAIAKPRRGDRARSISAPTTGPPIAADAVSEATMSEPVVALPRVAIDTTSGNAAGNGVTFSSTLDGNQTLGITAGTGLTGTYLYKVAKIVREIVSDATARLRQLAARAPA